MATIVILVEIKVAGVPAHNLFAAKRLEGLKKQAEEETSQMIKRLLADANAQNSRYSVAAKKQSESCC